MKRLPFDKPRKKSKIWSMTKADNEFSLFIRNRDGKCLRCGSVERLTCSHYWSRRKAALRYEPDNCITLCWFKCHKYGWEKEKHGKYRDFMMERLGEKRFEELRAIYYAPTIKMKDAILKCMEWLAPQKNLPSENVIQTTQKGDKITMAARKGEKWSEARKKVWMEKRWGNRAKGGKVENKAPIIRNSGIVEPDVK